MKIKASEGFLEGRKEAWYSSLSGRLQCFQSYAAF